MVGGLTGGVRRTIMDPEVAADSSFNKTSIEKTAAN